MATINSKFESAIIDSVRPLLNAKAADCLDWLPGAKESYLSDLQAAIDDGDSVFEISGQNTYDGNPKILHINPDWIISETIIE
jgi:hypothetical protein